MTEPYTYVIIHKPTNMWYYGVRYKVNCTPSDLWIKYFTSSKYIHELITQYGKESFSCHIRKTFGDINTAIKWEKKVLRRIIRLNNNINNNIRWCYIL